MYIAVTIALSSAVSLLVKRSEFLNRRKTMSNQIQQYRNKDEIRLPQGMIEDEVELRELLSLIVRKKLFVIAVTAVFAISSALLAIYLPNVYKAEASLAPVETDGNAGGLAALAGQFGGLASMAGINLGSGGTDNVQLAIEVMKSRKFISDFIDNHNILPELMAVKRWDINKNKLLFDTELYNPADNAWVRKVESPYKQKPSLQEAYKEFMKVFSISRSKDTGIVTVTVEHLSPVVAQEWVNWLVADINQTMKRRDVEEAKRGLSFLEEQLRKTDIADMRTVLYQLMEQAQKTIMFANVRDEYVFKTIDPALVSEEKAKPNRIMIGVLGAVLGCMLAIMIVLIRYLTFGKE